MYEQLEFSVAVEQKHSTQTCRHLFDYTQQIFDEARYVGMVLLGLLLTVYCFHAAVHAGVQWYCSLMVPFTGRTQVCDVEGTLLILSSSHVGRPKVLSWAPFYF